MSNWTAAETFVGRGWVITDYKGLLSELTKPTDDWDKREEQGLDSDGICDEQAFAWDGDPEGSGEWAGDEAWDNRTPRVCTSKGWDNKKFK